MNSFYPSLIAADLLSLKKEVQLLDPHVPGYHIDVMDFHFVPNLTFGPDTINALRSITDKQFLVHLMVDYPEKYFERMFLFEGDIVSIHPEAPSEHSLQELLQIIAKKGWIASIALSPHTDTSIVKELNPPHVLLMSVKPGFSGQTFMPLVYTKLKELEGYYIAIDGGVNIENAKQLIEAGARQLVVGSALFKKGNPLKDLQKLQDSIE